MIPISTIASSLWSEDDVRQFRFRGSDGEGENVSVSFSSEEHK